MFKENKNFKVYQSPEYNYIFNKHTGAFVRWGKTKDDDPVMAPSPEILDIEISVNGCKMGCKWCYKNSLNTAPTNMTLEQFKMIMEKFRIYDEEYPEGYFALTQIALGITNLKTNPDFIPIMEHARSLGIIPNFTTTGLDLDKELADKLSKLTGALAVSVQEEKKDIGYNAIKMFTNRGVSQTNIHLMFAEERLDFIWEVLNDRINDSRLKDMGAIVFLTYKPKGRNAGMFTPPNIETYQKVIGFCLKNQIPFGFDSCGAPRFEQSIESLPLLAVQKKGLKTLSESCESSLFSSYINVKGEYFACSFTEGEAGYEPIDVLSCNNFIDDIWMHPKTVKFRKNLINTTVNGCRNCPIFKL